MLVRVYRTEPCTASVLRASLIAAVEVDQLPGDPEKFANDYGGDFIETEPLDPEEEEHGALWDD